MALPKKIEQPKPAKQRTVTTTEIDEKNNKRGATGIQIFNNEPNSRKTVVSQNKVIDIAGETLIDIYDYKLVTDLVDGGLNAVELKGFHSTLGEHVVFWNLDNENVFEYIIGTPKGLTKKETNQLTLDVRNLIDDLIIEIIENEEN